MRNLLLSATVLAASCTTAMAGFTDVRKVPTFEHSQERVFEQLYGGDFTRIGTDFFNGGISIRRVDDGMTHTPSMSMAKGTIGDTTDETWAGAKVTIKPLGRWSGNSQSLSINDGGKVSKLFDVSGYGYSINDVSVTRDLFGKNIEFIREGDSGRHSSITANNADGRDHMITYEVLGLSGKDKVWVMMWEDLNLSPLLTKGRTSADYNDLIVEMRATAVPLPAAVWAGLAVVGGATVLRKRFRKIAGI